MPISSSGKSTPSRRIADIITVIDGLNAAVEAARQEPIVTAEEWQTF